MNIIAFNDGYNSAKNGVNINNSYPYTKIPYFYYYDWLDGYNSYMNNKL